MADKKGEYTSEDSVDSLVSSLVAERMETILNKMISNLKKELANISKDSTKAAKDVYDTLDDLETQYNSKKIDMFAKTSETQKKIIQIQAKFEESLMQESNAKERIALLNTQATRIKEFQKTYEKQKKLQKELAKDKEIWDLQAADRKQKLDSTEDKAEKKRLQKQYAAEEEALKKKISANQKYLNSHSESDYGESGAHLRDIELNKADLASKSGSKEDRDASKDVMKELLKQNKNDVQAKKTLSDLSQKDLQEAAAHRKEEKDEAARERREQIKFRAQQLKTLLDFSEDSKAVFSDLANEGFDAMMKAIEQPISEFFQYQAKYEARLQDGRDNDYNKYGKLLGKITTQIGLSPFIKQRDMVKKLQDLIDKGVNYNVELRAYIATVSEGIASTFDAFDSNLLRLIRIQQNDSTAARLGIEAALTKMLNNMYSDTSYLSGVSDQVSQALLDASAQLTHQGAAEMEFVAQKWLGSLYSLGVSNSAVETIAQGLGYLGAGNIEGLSGNESLMSLLSMSATRGGTSISEILTGGLTANNTEKLLRGMVEYLAEIANNTDSNNVTKASMAQVFGLTNTDLRSISNLTATDINTIANTDLNYGGALAETSNQLSQMWKRTHLSTIISNVIDNATVGSALTIGSNPVLYGMAKVLSLVSSLVGDRGMEIPGIQAMGSGTASGIDILSIAKAGLLGTAVMTQLIGSLNSIAGGGLPALSSWSGYEQSLQRGSGLKLQPKGVQSGFSESAQYSSRGNTSTDDLGAASMQSANDSAKENMSESDQKSKDLAETYYEEGLIHLKTIADTIQRLESETLVYKNEIRIDASNPVEVKLANNDSNNPSNAFKVHLSSMDPLVQQLFIKLIKAGMLGENSTDFGSADYEESNSDIFSKLKSELNGLEVQLSNGTFGIESALSAIVGGGIG